MIMFLKNIRSHTIPSDPEMDASKRMTGVDAKNGDNGQKFDDYYDEKTGKFIHLSQKEEG